MPLEFYANDSDWNRTVKMRLLTKNQSHVEFRTSNHKIVFQG